MSWFKRYPQSQEKAARYLGPPYSAVTPRMELADDGVPVSHSGRIQKTLVGPSGARIREGTLLQAHVRLLGSEQVVGNVALMDPNGRQLDERVYFTLEPGRPVHNRTVAVDGLWHILAGFDQAASAELARQLNAQTAAEQTAFVATFDRVFGSADVPMVG